MRCKSWESELNWGSSKGCLRIIKRLGVCRRVSFDGMMMELVWLQSPHLSEYISIEVENLGALMVV